MTTPIPVQLSGNLGHRHRCINDLVHQTYSKNVSFHTIQGLPEESTVDRLFKIDLARKYKNVDYILDTLKDDDLIFVARALKSTWLLQPEYSHIVNPAFLENELYPQMRLQSINKMKHWIHLNLRDAERCQCFYMFYKDSDFNLAAKFLEHCSKEFILREFSSILQKVNPKLLKRLSEKVPEVTKIYFDSLKENQTLLANYLKEDKKFFDTVKYVLKSDANVFFYVVENFFSIHRFSPFSSEITKYVMKNHKARFMNKPELYTWKFLDIKTVAKCLNSEEIKDLIRLLAKSEYLCDWFSYKNVEPLINNLKNDERTALKRRIFVDKDLGVTVKDWPYALPEMLTLNKPQNGLFKDKTFDWIYCESDIEEEDCFDMVCRKKKRKAMYGETFLDELFDEYRFKNFSQTFTELQKRLRAECSSQNRQYMLLVLISKTGGRLEDLISFFDLLKHFKNEPVHIRATIVRSLVKRAFVWRLPAETWANLMKWARGLGLNGSEPEAACSEGLHAVVLRDILANTTPTPEIWKAFLNDFSSFTDYKLTTDERRIISTRLPALLLAEAGSCPDKAAQRLDQLLDTLSAYHMRFDQYPGTVDAIAEIVKRDVELAKPLLLRLYTARAARKTLFNENFKLIPTDASYVNALRHNCSVLDDDDTEQFEKVAKASFIQERFIRKLALYFAEKDGLAQRYRDTLEALACNTKIKTSKSERVSLMKMARALALLAGSAFPSLLSKFKHVPREAQSDPGKKILAAALRANCHLVRPPFNIDSFGWKAVGAKAVANFVVTCRQKDVDENVQKTLTWTRTMRLSLLLAERENKLREVYKIVALKKPNVSLSSALLYFRCRGNNSDPEIWKFIRPVLEKQVITSRRNGFDDLINKLDHIPLTFKAEFCVILFKKYKKSSIQVPSKLFCNLIAVLPEVDERFLLEEIKEFLKNDFAIEMKTYNYEYQNLLRLYTDIMAKYLLLSTSNEVAEQRMKIIGNLFLKRIEDVWKIFAEKKDKESVTKVLEIINNFLSSLKYSVAFFDTKYTCLPVFERLCEWMQRFLPIEKWFDVYCTLHLTMLYFKSIRLCVENNPEIFAAESKKLKEGVKMLGITYGKFIGKAIEDLTQKYYPSIINLYEHEVENYLSFLCMSRDESTEKFKLAVMKGILLEPGLSPHVVALHLYLRFNKQYKDPYLNDIENIFKATENNELRFHIVCNEIDKLR